MKKIYFYMMTAIMALTMASCSDWDTPYYVDDIVGSWVSEYGRDAYGDYDLYGYDVVRYDFYSNHTGRYTAYEGYILYYVDFDWDIRGNVLHIRYYDGQYESVYYGFDHYGYLVLSHDSRFYYYVAYSPSGFYYAPAKTEEEGAAAVTGEQAVKLESNASIKTESRAVKARAEE